MNEDTERRRKQMWEKGMTLSEIAREEGRTISCISAWARERGLPKQSSMRIEKAKAKWMPLYRQGYSVQQISKALNVSESTIQRWVREAGLQKPKRKKKNEEETTKRDIYGVSIYLPSLRRREIIMTCSGMEEAAESAQFINQMAREIKAKAEKIQ